MDTLQMLLKYKPDDCERYSWQDYGGGSGSIQFYKIDPDNISEVMEYSVNGWGSWMWCHPRILITDKKWTEAIVC